WVGAGRFESTSTPEMLGGSPLATGPFGAFLLGIFGNSEVHFFYEREEALGGKNLLAYRYRVPVALSRYELLVGERRRTIPYDGMLFLDPDSAELRRLTVHTTALEAGLRVCEATTTVDFGRQRIGDTDYLLPRESRLYAVGIGTESENVTTWSGCRQYRADSVIHFDEAGAVGRTPQVSAADGAGGPLPPGTIVTLALETEIDTGVAAAGDEVVARLEQEVIDSQTKRVLAPAGARVHGRITRMEHHLVEPRSFHISILFETLESLGVTTPFSAELDSKAGRLSEFTISAAEQLNAQSASAAALRPDTSESAGRTLVFPTTRERYVVPRGYEMRWKTK
ncbi:MAG TPA: TrbI/VirB10 family protein, partial [Bryobacteraceae bacterium]